MRILIDFGSIKSGGAAQLAINFIDHLKAHAQGIEGIFLLLPSTGPLSKSIDSGNFEGTLSYPDNYAARKIFEAIELAPFLRKNKINTIYTFFGSGLPKPKGVSSVVSVAYPIICYPDSPYWHHVPLAAKLKKLAIGALRKRRIRRADVVLAETAVMAGRLNQHAGVSTERLVVIPPSPSAFIAERPFNDQRSPQASRFLFLSGLDRHKNLWRLPDLARALIDAGCDNFRFVISAQRQDFEATYAEYCHGLGAILDRHFDFIGSIPPREIQAAYEQVSFLVNISDLESFSNNYMEAWKTGLPLICSDTDFARHICGDSATYIDPHDPAVAARIISGLISDREAQRAQVEEGKRRLSGLPRLDERFSRILAVIRAMPR